MSSRRRPTCRKSVGTPKVLSCPANVFEKRTVKEETYDSDSPEVLSSSDEEDRWKDTARTADIPAEYWNIQKLMKYIKAGNPTTTMVSLNCIMDYDLDVQINQLAILVCSGCIIVVFYLLMLNIIGSIFVKSLNKLHTLRLFFIKYTGGHKIRFYFLLNT